MTFDGENHALQIWLRIVCECLHRVNRAGSRAATRQRLQHGIVERAAAVQHDLAAAFLAPDPGQTVRDARQNIVRRQQQNNIGIHHRACECGERLARADRAHGGARMSRGARDHRADAPSQTVQRAAERAAQASCADDGNRARHAK